MITFRLLIASNLSYLIFFYHTDPFRDIPGKVIDAPDNWYAVSPLIFSFYKTSLIIACTVKSIHF